MHNYAKIDQFMRIMRKISKNCISVKIIYITDKSKDVLIYTWKIKLLDIRKPLSAFFHIISIIKESLHNYA